jgi:hypothetical protein
MDRVGSGKSSPNISITILLYIYYLKLILILLIKIYFKKNFIIKLLNSP